MCATIYRWIDRHGRTGTVTSLLRETPSGGSGKGRIPAEVEDIIKHYIKERYLTRQKPKASVIIGDVQRACRRAGLQPPHPNTVRARLKRVPGRLRAKRRQDKRAIEAHRRGTDPFPATCGAGRKRRSERRDGV